MSGPITQSYECENCVRPSYPHLLADRESNMHATFDNSVNKSLPYIWFTAVIAAISIGMSISEHLYVSSLKDKTTVSENHWRNIETDVSVLKKQSESCKNGN